MGRSESGRQDVTIYSSCRDAACDDAECVVTCECGRDSYPSCNYSSCYQCFLDRRADYIGCIYCGRWHSPEFDTCFGCRPQGRDEAAKDLKLVILARDGPACRYCGVRAGDLQLDPRLVRPKCPPLCAAQHNHRRPCEPDCRKRHKHRKEGEPGMCRAGCSVPHSHLIKDDDGMRPATLHIDHIKPCAKGGTADPWNLQTLCGVCNVSKGADYWDFSRHDRARQRMIAAYLTYLWGYLNEDQQADLQADAEYLGLTATASLGLIVADYRDRVWACRPRPPIRALVAEDVPPEYAEFDLAALQSLGCG